MSAGVYGIWAFNGPFFFSLSGIGLISTTSVFFSYFVLYVPSYSLWFLAKTSNNYPTSPLCDLFNIVSHLSSWFFLFSYFVMEMRYAILMTHSHRKRYSVVSKLPCIIMTTLWGRKLRRLIETICRHLLSVLFTNKFKPFKELPW